jgi:prepilin-type processing-associated H-X9-DG protein
MVVIAIIAILVALLAPSLSNARESSKSLVCMNNLRQLALAANLYANDHDDFFPDAYDGGVSVGNIYYYYWCMKVNHYLCKINGTLVENQADLARHFALNTTYLHFEVRGFDPYYTMYTIRKSPIYNNPFFCPANLSNYGTSYGTCVNQGVVTDYTINACASGAPNHWSGWPRSRRAELPCPEKLILFADGAGAGGMESGNASYYSFTPRHMKKTRCNVVLVDGHTTTCRWDFDYYDAHGSNELNTKDSASTTSDPRYKAFMYR